VELIAAGDNRKQSFALNAMQGALILDRAMTATVAGLLALGILAAAPALLGRGGSRASARPQPTFP
jgi:hypothetical protein